MLGTDCRGSGKEYAEKKVYDSYEICISRRYNGKNLSFFKGEFPRCFTVNGYHSGKSPLSHIFESVFVRVRI